MGMLCAFGLEIGIGITNVIDAGKTGARGVPTRFFGRRPMTHDLRSLKDALTTLCADEDWLVEAERAGVSDVREKLAKMLTHIKE